MREGAKKDWVGGEAGLRCNFLGLCHLGDPSQLLKIEISSSGSSSFHIDTLMDKDWLDHKHSFDQG
jgi:hypothetical protein